MLFWVSRMVSNYNQCNYRNRRLVVRDCKAISHIIPILQRYKVISNRIMRGRDQRYLYLKSLGDLNKYKMCLISKPCYRRRVTFKKLASMS